MRPFSYALSAAALAFSLSACGATKGTVPATTATTDTAAATTAPDAADAATDEGTAAEGAAYRARKKTAETETIDALTRAGASTWLTYFQSKTKKSDLADAFLMALRT